MFLQGQATYFTNNTTYFDINLKLLSGKNTQKVFINWVFDELNEILDKSGLNLIDLIGYYIAAEVTKNEKPLIQHRLTSESLTYTSSM